MDTAVDWGRLAEAVRFYEARGYARREVPWFVPRDIQEITCPFPQNIMSVAGLGCLVGSAEQAFLALALAGDIVPGRYLALTPCFRDEPEDVTHTKTFMKVELFACGPEDQMWAEAERMRDDALAFMTGAGRLPDTVETPAGWDLEICGVEVGSYGTRRARGLTWAYGTGLAEPRFSYAAGLAA